MRPAPSAPPRRQRAAEGDQLARRRQGRVARHRGERAGAVHRDAARSADAAARLPQRRRRRRWPTPSSPNAKSPIAGVSVEAAESLGAPASRVRVALAQPVAHRVRSERNTVVVDFDKPSAEGGAVRPAARHERCRTGARRDAGAAAARRPRIRSPRSASTVPRGRTVRRRPRRGVRRDAGAAGDSRPGRGTRRSRGRRGAAAARRRRRRRRRPIS